MFKKEKENYGIDLGESKIIISKCASDDSDESDVTNEIYKSEVIADMMDIRNIPNTIMFSNDPDQSRKFGNIVPEHKAFKSDNKSDNKSILLTEDLVIGNLTLSNIPLFIIKNMVLTHIEKIIKTRNNESAFDNIIVVPTLSESTLDALFGVIGVNCAISSKYNKINIKFISSINAAIMSYLGKHILSSNKINNSNKNILIIDIGHSKTNFVLFNVFCKNEDINRSNNEGNNDVDSIDITCRLSITDKSICGKNIDDHFCNYISQRIKNECPNFIIDKNDEDFSNNKSFRTKVNKLKQQLSSNHQIKFIIEGIDNDVSIIVTRDNLEDIIMTNDMVNKLNNALELILQKENNIDHVEIIGGSSRVPLFKNAIENKFPKIYQTMNPDEAIANGASTYGFLLKNTKNIKKLQKINFIREVKKNVIVKHIIGTDINKNNIVDTITIFNKSEYVHSTFDHDKKIKKYNNSNSDTRIIKIRATNKFLIQIDDIALVITIHESHLSNKKNKYYNVYLTYNMLDLVDVLCIKDSDNLKNSKNIKFNIEIHSENESYDLKALYKTYCANENIIRNMEEISERRQNVINYMEGFYYDKESCDNLLKTITNKNNLYEHHAPDKSDTSTISLSNVSLKNVQEFYSFCKIYTDEPITDKDIEKQESIKNLLHDDYALGKLEEAVTIIKNIQQYYKE